MSLRDRLEILDLMNSVQNDLNSFVNIDNDDLTKVINYIDKHDLDAVETRDLLVELFTNPIKL